MGYTRCGQAGCAACKFAPGRVAEGRGGVREVHLRKADMRIPVTQALNCKSENVLYALQCTADGDTYLGCTGNMARDRLGQHLGDIRNDRVDKVVAEHFCSHGGRQKTDNVSFWHLRKS